MKYMFLYYFHLLAIPLASQYSLGSIGHSENYVMYTLCKGVTQLHIVQGDILAMPVEAIVNAANKELQAGAGVCGAIFKAAGHSALQKACDRHGGCAIGCAVITDSFNLTQSGIKKIIHAVGPKIENGKKVTIEDQKNLTAAYSSSLLLAESEGISSIAFPFISSGIYAYPKQEAASIALHAFAQYAMCCKDVHKMVKDIYYVLFSQEDFELVCSCAKLIFLS